MADRIIIEFTRPLFSLPLPYNQLAFLADEAGFVWEARTTPNVQRPGQEDRPNLAEYPVLAQGVYSGQVIYGGYKGRTGILINGGRDVPGFQALNPRFPDQGRMIRGVWVHEGQKDSWPGSAGCLTLAPGGAEWIEGHLTDGEMVTLIVPGIEPGYLSEDVGDYGRVHYGSFRPSNG